MKTWTRPKIRVQKFAPDFCQTTGTCYTDFWSGEAWVEAQNHDGSNNINEFDYFFDYYNNNWLPEDPLTGKNYVLVTKGSAYRVDGGWRAYQHITGNHPPVPPTSTNDGWEYDGNDYQLTEVPKGSGSGDYVYVISINGTATLLARRTNKNAS